MSAYDSSFSGTSILVTGGTGSFGKSLVKALLESAKPKKVIIYSRDEFKQFEMRSSFSKDESRLRWFIGDVRDKERLVMALRGVDLVVHAAALKQVETGEYNPSEFIKTNVIGSQNLVEAAIESGVKRVVGLSTDKASSPINLYGATKLTADKLFVGANHYGSISNTKFSVVRYGNVVGSRGSVIPVFYKSKSSDLPFKITDPRMTRFWITLEQAVEFVLQKMISMKGGEIFVPKIPSARIVHLAEAIDAKRRIDFIGIRPGEKLHEEMISENEGRKCIRLKDGFAILNDFTLESFYKKAKLVEDGFSYTSGNNPEQLSVKQIQNLLSIAYPEN